MPTNPLASLKIDRCAERREQSDWIEQAAVSDQTRFVVTHNGRLLASGNQQLQLHWLSASQLDRQHHEFPYFAFLGLRQSVSENVIEAVIGDAATVAVADAAVFVVELDESSVDDYADAHQAQWVGARRLAMTGRSEDAGIAAYGRALTLWQRNHRHCGRCGTATALGQAGFRLLCTNRECRHQHFPRLDPAVIVAIGYQGRCLFGRQPSWPANRYSTLAGFVEPGESLEDAVIREVAEESGVRIASATYHSSQPWPFPSSLMLGFMAEAAGPELSLGDELEDACWLNAEELRVAMQQGEVILPPPLSISQRLIRDWYSEHYAVDIRNWQTGADW